MSYVRFFSIIVYIIVTLLFYSLSHVWVCSAMDSRLPGFLSMDFPGKNTGMGCDFLFQGTFLTQGSNCVSCIGRGILYHRATWEAHRSLQDSEYSSLCCTLGPCCLSISYIVVCILTGFPGSSASKESTCNAGDLGSISGWGRSPGGEHGDPLQYSCLENPMDREAWWATVFGVARSQTQLSIAQHSIYL